MVLLRLTAMSFVVGIALPAAPQAADEQVLRVPSMPDWQLIHKVDPEYPAAALHRRIQGTVRFSALIGKDGRVETLRLISGHPLLVRAARKAAQQWVYSPTLIGGKPIRVITLVDIHFQLDPSGNPLKNDNRKPEVTAAVF